MLVSDKRLQGAAHSLPGSTPGSAAECGLGAESAVALAELIVGVIDAGARCMLAEVFLPQAQD